MKFVGNMINPSTCTLLFDAQKSNEKQLTHLVNAHSYTKINVLFLILLQLFEY